jgi:cytochrome c biogenesis protein CcmG, thiol:disulfide interchange protein DsbE
VPSVEEVLLLTSLSRDKRLQVIGINYMQGRARQCRRFLGGYGNPYGFVGVDGDGRATIEWGVYGVPETFIVGREGKIVYTLVGLGDGRKYRHGAEGRNRPALVRPE